MSLSLLFLSLTGHSFRISHRAPRRAIPFSLFRDPSTVAPTGRGRKQREGDFARSRNILPFGDFCPPRNGRTDGGRRSTSEEEEGLFSSFHTSVRSLPCPVAGKQGEQEMRAGEWKRREGPLLCQFARNFPTCSMLCCTVMLVPIRRGGEAKVEIMWRRNAELSE